jgi:TolB-like protein/DNA-binding SARP family transcriptional activator/Tfp pilus assembly protein PilF
MFLLRTFGGLSLESDDAPLPAGATQRRRLALLAILAGARGRGVSRDRLIALLWPDKPEEKARHALEQLVYACRRDLGREVFLTSGTALLLNEAVVRSDVAALEAAVREGDADQAVSLYRGTFLDGIYWDGAPDLERWVDSERERLARAYAGALRKAAESAEAAGDSQAAAERWRQLAAHDPYDSGTALCLMRALEAAGDRAGAIQHARVHSTLLREDLDVEPDPEIAILLERLRQEPAKQPAALPDPPPPAPVTASSAAPPPATASSPELRDSPPEARGPGIFRSWRRRAVLAAALTLLLSAAVATWGVSRNPLTSVAAAPASVAVLPFVDMSSGGDSEYLSDGITEELIHALSQVEGLRVVARTSVFAFKGKGADVRDIGEALNVQAVLEGSVRRSGEQLRITVQLIDARNGYHLWSQVYDRRMADVFGVQEEISRSVVRTLQPALLPGSNAPLVSVATENPDAYQLYMQGRYFWNQRTEEGLYKAVDRFEEAIRLDPGYATAYSGLSDAHNALADNGYVPSEPALTKAEAAVRTALKLDSELAEAHTSLGHLKLHRWDWSGAEQDFRRSIELNPGYAVAYQYYAFLLAFQGRYDEAVPLIRKAQQLDPLSLAIQSNVGNVLYAAQRYPEAAEQLRFALDMDSTREETRQLLASALTELGRYDEAVAELRRVIATAGGWHRSAVAVLGYTYARAGRLAEAEQVRKEIELARGDGKSLSPYYYAGFLGALGRRDEAFAMLDQALATQGSGLVAAGVSPTMHPLRSDPRFERFLRRLNLSATGP